MIFMGIGLEINSALLQWSCSGYRLEMGLLKGYVLAKGVLAQQRPETNQETIFCFVQHDALSQHLGKSSGFEPRFVEKETNLQKHAETTWLNGKQNALKNCSQEAPEMKITFFN